MAKIINLSGLAAMVTRMASRAYQAPPNVIQGVSSNNYPTVSQPVQPIGPPGSKPLVSYFQYGQNFNYTPRPDAAYTAADLKVLSMYPLSRICIDNTKDTLCQMDWEVRLRALPGETEGDVKARRRKSKKGDENILKISRFLERPNPEADWSEWLRSTLEDMLVTDSASTLLVRKNNGKMDSLWWTPGEYISRYLDDSGRTPQPPSPAYAQLWEGMPRINLTTAQLVYKPRNIVPRVGVVSSYLYGCSPVETIADELKIGIARLMYVLAYYQDGSVGNMIHVAPPEVTPDKVEEAVKIVNSQMSGQLGKRRQYTILQGFQKDGKADQVIFPNEPTLADVFDDIHIRKIAFAFGNSPQRLQRAMNRGSAQTSQSAAQEEGIRPWMDWVQRYVNFIIQVRMGYSDYEIDITPYFEADLVKRSKMGRDDVHEGIRTRDEVREDCYGLDPLASENPLANKLTVTTANGVVELGEVIVSGKGGGDGSGGENEPKPSKPKPSTSSLEASSGKVNGKARLIQRGEM